jgi:hypothetical protein
MFCLRESGVELCRIARIDCNQFEPRDLAAPATSAKIAAAPEPCG